MSGGKPTTINLVFSGLISKELVEHYLLILKEIKALFTCEMALAESGTSDSPS